MQNRSIGIFDVFNSIGGWKIKAIKLFDLMIGSCLARIVSAKSGSDMITGPIKKVLIIRPGGIGDAIFLLPLLRRLKNQNPGLQLDILCETRNQQVFQSQDSVCDQIYCYDQGFCWRELFGGAYDVIIDTEQWHYLSAFVSYFLTSRVNIGFASRPLRSKLFNRAVPYQENVYEIENFKNLFVPVFPNAVEVRDISNSFFIDDETLRWAQNAVPSDSIALFLGASVILKRLDFSQNTTLIDILFNQRKGRTIILLGGSDVKREAEAICRYFQNSSSPQPEVPRGGGAFGRRPEVPLGEEPIGQILSFVGKTTLQQSAALIKRSQLFIGPDSGLMHLANAVGTPVIAIFGPTNHQKWGPRGERDKIVTLNVVCSPCTRFGYTVPTCRGTYKCMRDIRLRDIDSLNDI